MNYYPVYLGSGSGLPGAIADLLTVSVSVGTQYANAYRNAESAVRNARSAVAEAEAEREKARILRDAAKEYKRIVGDKGSALDRYTVYALGGGAVLILGILLWPRKK